MLIDEFNKLKTAKSEIRKAIQRKNVGLQTSEYFNVYPSYIEAMKDGDKNVDNTGLLEYCEDYYTYFTVNVDKIRDYAFYGWTNLHCLIIPSETLVPLGNHALEGTSITSIIVPSNLSDKYKVATNWKQYRDCINNIPKDPYSYTSTNLVQHEEHVRTVTWLEGLTIEQLITDYR